MAAGPGWARQEDSDIATESSRQQESQPGPQEDGGQLSLHTAPHLQHLQAPGAGPGLCGAEEILRWCDLPVEARSQQEQLRPQHAQAQPGRSRTCGESRGVQGGVEVQLSCHTEEIPRQSRHSQHGSVHHENTAPARHLNVKTSNLSRPGQSRGRSVSSDEAGDCGQANCHYKVKIDQHKHTEIWIYLLGGSQLTGNTIRVYLYKNILWVAN